MRITNKIIQNNSLTNINTNKTLQDKLSTMISTEKKITRPSDDPIIALRSLRLRTSVNQTDQYRSKNVEDAKSWLTVTEDAINTLSEIITDVRKQYTKGSNDPLTSSDRRIILENLESLAAEVYNTGNADFAGRSVFTGYRTDTTLTFQQDSKYNLEDAEIGNLYYGNYGGNTIPIGVLGNAQNSPLTYPATDRYQLTFEQNGRTITRDVINFDSQNNPGNVTTPDDYLGAHPDAVIYDVDTGRILLGQNIATASNYKLGRADSIFDITETKDSVTIDTINYVHENESDETQVSTNEIMRIRLSYDKLSSVKFGESATSGAASYQFSFITKDGTQWSTAFADGDPNKLTVTTLSNTITTDETATPPVYSPYDYVINNPTEAVFIPETGELLLGKDIMGTGTSLKIDDIESLNIDYQKAQWNKGDLRPQHYFKCTDLTDTDNIIKYNHDDAIKALRDVESVENRITDLKKELEAIPEAQTAQRAAVQAKIDAAEKAKTFYNETLHTLFSKGITKADGYLADNNLALTDCGTRSKRLELIENRLDTQLSTLKELKSENEDADMAETAIRLTSAKYAYDASLMATSKSIQQTLLNYI